MRIPETEGDELPGSIPVIMVHPEHRKKRDRKSFIEEGRRLS